MSDQADGLRRLVRSRGEPGGATAEAEEEGARKPPPKPRPRLLAALAARWGRRGRADCSA